MDESFGKDEKLKSKKLIDILFQEGKSVKKYPLKLIYLPITNPEITTFKTGVSVPKKLVKTAVGRNRIKRLMREAFRKNKYLVTSNFTQPYALMFIYISRDEISLEDLNKAMIKVMEKFNESENKIS
ncbi:ribonuclease P protein component [Salegentibacter agarivorans]|jgi:ribonuclease P protein component|uniref:ribonuclease P protein component n=1 Tax=Salegentibacter sp. BDJ18 TaxID=2816376 RepID=UPI001AAF6681|nr:ribonuclease P protein component [Salegentibacter sp. BDJ18]MBO2543553.1 ribonuclease P protein component [Salegentibacter sp. BDJ18]|tara:strand:+ start:247 stop:627 length:381 start_codon:yes stop_codon:yes gene_type:complete